MLGRSRTLDDRRRAGALRRCVKLLAAQLTIRAWTMPPPAPLPTIEPELRPVRRADRRAAEDRAASRRRARPRRASAAAMQACGFHAKQDSSASADAAMNDPTTIRRLYGRSKGRPLRAGQSALVEELLPALSVPDEGPIDARALFGDDRPLHFEIGFGARRASRLARRPAARSRLHRRRALPQRRRRRARPYPRPAPRQCPPAHGRRARRARAAARREPALRLSAPSRSLAEGAPRQAADGQSRPARPDRGEAGSRAASSGSAPTIRSIAAGR